MSKEVPNDDKTPQASHTTPVPGHEPESTSVRAVGIFFVVLLASLVAVGIAIAVMLDLFAADAREADPPRSPFETARQLPPSPRLQVDHALDWDLLQEQQTRVLTSYGWVDRERGVVRVPIDRAMELYLERAPQTPNDQVQPQGNQP